MKCSPVVVRFAQSFAMAMLLTGTAAASFAAPTAQEIMQKSSAAMKGSKTYQAVLESTIIDQTGTMSMQVEVKKSGNTWVMKTSPLGQATGSMETDGAPRRIMSISDGKMTLTYYPTLNRYTKLPAGHSESTKWDDFTGMFKRAAKVDLRLVGTESIAGKPAYVIEETPIKAGEGYKTMKRYWIDQETYRFKQMKVGIVSDTGGKDLTGKSQTPQTTTVMLVKSEMAVLITSEIIDQPIPDSVFKFTPPAGATEMKGGMAGMMGGMGGGRRPAKK
jgi:outer membrane lipoprotein-sorting protein